MIDPQILVRYIKLSETHKRKLLVESGISEDVAAERHYNTATVEEYAKIFAEAGEISMIPRLPGLLIPIFGPDGKEAGAQLRPDSPINGAKYVSPKRSEAAILLDTHPRIIDRLRDASVDLWITEGILKADSAISRGLCCIGLLGVWMAFRKNARGGVEAMPGWDRINLTERNVYVAFDSDIMTKPNVRKALIRLQAFLQGRGAFTHIVYLPSGPNDEKVGLDDYFVAGHTVADLYAQARLPKPDAMIDTGGRPAVSVDEGDLHKVTTDALNALRESNDPVALMMRGGRLIRIERDERSEVVVRELSVDGVRYELAARIAWFGRRNGEPVSARAPREVAVNVLESPAPDFPPLNGVTEVPTFRPDGTLHAEPGYDAATGWYYCPANGVELPSIPDEPTDAEVEAARTLLLDELLVDFPFVADRDRAHALALALLPFARGLITGPTPLHVIEAPTHGSGKGKLARALLTIGRRSQIASTPWPSSEEEIEKRLLSFLATGVPALIFDNVQGTMRSSSLCLALTEPVYTGRILGKTHTPKFVIRTIWAMTSNNASLHKDIVRRSIPCRIDPGVERPFQREGFRHPNLEEWSSENRTALLGAALTLVRAWIVRGRPISSNLRPLGSYESWSSAMGGILDVARVPGFLTGLDDFYESADSEQSPWVEFFVSWHGEYQDKPVKARDIFDLASSSGLVFPNGSEASQMVRFGKQLQFQRDRIISGYRIVRDLGSSDGSSRWICQKVTSDSRKVEGGTDSF